MTVSSAFQPARGQNQKVSATTSSQTITIGKGNKTIRALNAGATVCYFVTFSSVKQPGLVATTSDTPIGPAGAASSVTFIEKPEDHDSLSFIADSGTPTLNFQPGEGCS